jgi:hypothetical protein
MEETATIGDEVVGPERACRKLRGTGHKAPIEGQGYAPIVYCQTPPTLAIDDLNLQVIVAPA